MYTTLKRTLIQHLQTLEHDFLCLDLSIVDWNDIQMRRLESLRLSIDCLRFTVQGFATSHEPLPFCIREEVCEQIMTIADIAQLLLHRSGDDLGQNSSNYLQEFIFALKRIYEDIDAYTANASMSA